MKIDLKIVVSLILGATICYGYFFLNTNLAVSRLQGQVEVFSQFCKPQLEQSGIIKGETKK